MFHALTCVDCHTQARQTVQEAKESSQESEDDWEANADMDAVPAIGPAAAQAKQKVPLHVLCALHVLLPSPTPGSPMPFCIACTTYICGTGQVSCWRVVGAALVQHVMSSHRPGSLVILI